MEPTIGNLRSIDMNRKLTIYVHTCDQKIEKSQETKAKSTNKTCTGYYHDHFGGGTRIGYLHIKTDNVSPRLEKEINEKHTRQ